MSEPTDFDDQHEMEGEDGSTQAAVSEQQAPTFSGHTGEDEESQEVEQYQQSGQSIHEEQEQEGAAETQPRIDNTQEEFPQETVEEGNQMQTEQMGVGQALDATTQGGGEETDEQEGAVSSRFREGSVRAGGEEEEEFQEERPFPGGVAVTFHVEARGKRTMHAMSDDTASQLKLSLANAMGVDPVRLVMAAGGKELADEETLEEQGLGKSDTVHIDVRVKGSEAGSKKGMEEWSEEEVTMPSVPVDRSQQEEKRWLGGYRNKATGREFHHAETQTSKAVQKEWPIRYEREAQTKEMLTRSQQTKREASTQMARKDLVLDGSQDVIVEPGPYMTAEEYERLKVEKAIEIQRWVRGWLGRRKADELRRLRDEREAFYHAEQERKGREKEEEESNERERRMKPRTASDFDKLYSELERWRRQETAKIKNSSLDPQQRQEELQGLLQKETRLLQAIDRLKIGARQENRERRVNAVLSDLASAQEWASQSGATVQVHTPYTTRAAELKQLYDGLNLPNPTIDERFDVLLHVKWAVKEFDNNLTREIATLIDREADLLDRGRPARSLYGLRRRIAHLFLQFIETPMFNPAASKFQLSPSSQAPSNSALQPILSSR